MGRTHISNDPSGRIIVSFPYDPLLVEKVKSIDGRKWHPAEKHWSFPSSPYPPHRRGREREGVKMLESLAFPVTMELFPRNKIPSILAGEGHTSLPSPLGGEGKGEGYSFEDH